MTRLRRYAAFGYGVAAYVLALATIAYAVAFLANVVVPRTVDGGPVGPPVVAVLVDAVLLGLFGLQHSLMARPWFKVRWTRLVPEPVERSTYVLFASLALLVLMWAWRPLPAVVWRVDGYAASALWVVYAAGWLLMLAAVNTIDGPELMGLRQVTAYLRGRELAPVDFQTPGLYRYVRHPIMTGFLLSFWVTPRMTLGHLLFAVGTTAYVLVGVTLEQRDLLDAFGDRYRTYRRDVPMFVPRPWQVVSTRRTEADGDRSEGPDVR